MSLVVKGLIIWESKCHQKSPAVLSDGYVQYEEVEAHRSAIMQDFRDNDKKIKMADWRQFFILIVRNLSWVILTSVSHNILFYIHGPAILHLFELHKYHKITKIQNGR